MRQLWAFVLGVSLVLVACQCKKIVPIPTGIDWSPLDQLLNGAVADGVFPGCVALIGSPKGVLYAKPFGSFTYGIPPPYNPGKNPNVTLDTMYDMASCSKVVGGTSAIAQFYQRGELDLDAPITDFLGPAYAAQGKGPITVRNCLLHNAGYPPDPSPNYYDPGVCPETVNYYPNETFSCQSILLNSLLNQTLQNPIGTIYVYSDLSFITLSYVVGALAYRGNYIQQSDLLPSCAAATAGNLMASYQCYFEAYIRRYVFQALDMEHTGWLPNASLYSRCAPCDNDTDYRHTIKQGMVDDDNAYAAGGIAGHAGVYSTLADLNILMSRLLYATPQDDFLNSTTVQYFTTEYNHSQSCRALGWSTNDPTVPDGGWNQTCGSLSTKTFLHIGYTGTQLCADPERQIFTILLTNRVYPNVDNIKIEYLRQLWNTAVQQIVDAAHLPFLPTPPPSFAL